MNLYPLTDIPPACFPGTPGDASRLKLVRIKCKPIHGLFLVRYDSLKIPSATFVLTGNVDYSGRWLLGRVRLHKAQPGRYEILIRRAKTCYYRAVDTAHDVAEELRFLALDGDAELSEISDNPKSEWIITPDSEFTEMGFSTENAR